MIEKTSVDVAIPAYGAQPPKYWSQIASVIADWKQDFDVRLIWTQSAMPDVSKNLVIKDHLMDVDNHALTSYARNELVKQSRAEWLLFIDHDTVPPADGLHRLLAHSRPFIAGVYHHRNQPHAPPNVPPKRGRVIPPYSGL